VRFTAKVAKNAKEPEAIFEFFATLVSFAVKSKLLIDEDRW
jgi:hypothetical protein